MNKWRLVLIILIVCFFTVSSSEFQERKGNLGSPDTKNGLKSANIQIEKDYGKIPLTFIPNHGQMDKKVYYYIQGKDKIVYFTSNGLTYSLAGPVESKPGAGEKSNPRSFEEQREKEFSQPSKRWVVKLDFVGARKDVKPELLEKSGTFISYFKGKTEDWQTGLQAASKIIYRELWQGIDLVYYGTINKMKYEFIVHPGADPSQIKLAYRGTESVKENNKGQLEIQTPVGGFFDDTPVAWQEIAAKRESITLKYAIEKEKSTKQTGDAPVVIYGFTIGKYDPKETLRLDPAVIVYCGYIGGSGDDRGHGITVDSSGCAYVTGETNSTGTNFPVITGPFLTQNGDVDVFVAKVNAAGTGLIYCGYIGGSGYEKGCGIAVDTLGCTYVTGLTESAQSTFPVTVGPDLTYNGGGFDVFTAKINADGTALDYCGYIGGNNYEYGNGIAVDDSGCAYITGYTDSTQTYFPVTVGPNLTHNGFMDAFVAKVKADGTSLDYCGYIGGNNYEYGNGIAVDTGGCAYIIGETKSQHDSFPVTAGPDLTYNGEYDAFVAKVKADGTGFHYCGYIGGSSDDLGIRIAVDGSGCAYITGETISTETTFPVAGGPDLTHNGGEDAFVTKVKADGTALDYCGYIGGSDRDIGYGIAVDGWGCAHITGITQSNETTFPVTSGPDITYNGAMDAFVAKIKSDGSSLIFCGYIGGSAYDDCDVIAVNDSGYLYVGGFTASTSTTFPVTVGPDLTYNGGSFDAFLAKIVMNNIVCFAAGNGGSLTGITTQTVEYGGNCSAVEAVPNNGYEFLNWTGTRGFVTTTDNPLTVTNVVSDIAITANFEKNNPTGWIPLNGSQYNMIVYGTVFNDNNPAAEGDWIGAFGPGGISDCRAVATVQTNGNYYLTIGSNTTSSETISFKLWPLPSGPSIDSLETVSFIADGIYSDFLLHVGLKDKNFGLVKSWNWISFNILPVDTSFNSVFANLIGVIEQVKSQNHAAIYSGGTWIGDLTDMSGIADGLMYKVKVNQACSFNVTGMTIPYNKPLSLVTGWNWAAYLPTFTQPLETAINSIVIPVNQIKSQTKSVIKVDSTLVGDLTQMEPNKGYLILMNQAGVLEYPEGVSSGLSAKKITAKVQEVSWPLINGNQYNMVALGKVYFEGKPVNTSGFYLGSTGPNGANDGRSLSPVKTDGTYFATILGNKGGETVKFKLINISKGKTYDVAGSLVFQPDSLKTGFDLKVRSIKVTAPAAGTSLRMGTACTITWEAYEVNNVKIELYKGSKLLSTIASSVPASSFTYNWEIPGNLTAGNDYHVKVSGIDPGVAAEGWTNAFSIKPAVTIALISPNGGEVWQVKQDYNITWRSIGIENVRIELYKGRVMETIIAASTPAGTGKYTWIIPVIQPQGANYKIKISGVEVGISDTSDRVFSINGSGVGDSSIIHYENKR